MASRISRTARRIRGRSTDAARGESGGLGFGHGGAGPWIRGRRGVRMQADAGGEFGAGQGSDCKGRRRRNQARGPAAQFRLKGGREGGGFALGLVRRCHLAAEQGEEVGGPAVDAGFGQERLLELGGEAHRLRHDVGQDAQRQVVLEQLVEVGIENPLIMLAEPGDQLGPALVVVGLVFHVLDHPDLGHPVELAGGDLAGQLDPLAAEQQEVEPAVAQPLVLEDPAQAAERLQARAVGGLPTPPGAGPGRSRSGGPSPGRPRSSAGSGARRCGAGAPSAGTAPRRAAEKAGRCCRNPGGHNHHPWARSRAELIG